MVGSETNGMNGTTTQDNGLHAFTEAAGKKIPSLPSVDEFVSQEYDFVIAGGGTAALVVAARLTEDPNTTVAVIEAGKNKLGDMLVDIPSMYTQTFGNPDYDWNLMTEPQKANFNRSHHYVRGKALGGSSAINYEMYVRGSDTDYDDWAELAEDPSWAFQKFRQYFRKHQTLEPYDESIKDRGTMPFVEENHGRDGPVRTSFNDFRLPIEDDIIKAADEATRITKKPVDPWSGDHIGFFNTLGSVIRTGPNRGKRSYAARGYYEPNQNRPNLKILCEAYVEKVELDGDKATGVTFSFKDQTYTVKAKKEVVVSCGSLKSPQVLELSGIGNPEILKAAGVECKIENKAVGENFQDHAICPTTYEVGDGVATLFDIYKPEVMQAAQKTYAETQGGPLSCISSTQGFFPCRWFMTEAEVKETVDSIRETAKKSTPFQKKQLEQIVRNIESDKSANIQFVLVAAKGNFEDGYADQSKLFVPPESPNAAQGVSLAICLEYPVSRGSVHIKSSDPKAPPAIDPAFYSHPADGYVCAAGLKMVDQLSKSSHVADKFTKRVRPDPKYDLTDTAQAREAALQWVLSEYHPCGSVAMGDAVDATLLVRGTRNVRVVDASVFPNNVSGNICSSVYAVAEKGADIIKAAYA